MKKLLISGLLLLSLSSLIGCGYHASIENNKSKEIELSPYEKTDIVENCYGFDVCIYRDKDTNIAYRINTYRGIFDPVLGPDKQVLTLDEYKKLRGIE